MGYQPRNRTTHTIGYVLPLKQLTADTEVRFLQIVQQELTAQGFRLVLVDLDVNQLASLEHTLNPKTVDGVILRRWIDGRIPQMLPPEVPWVLAADEYGIGPEVDQVAPDSGAAMHHLMQYVLAQGHRDLCLVTGPAGIRSHDLIKAEYFRALQECGVEPSRDDVIEVSTPAPIAGQLLARLRQSPRPTAVIGVGGGNTASVLNVLQSEKIDVPGEISVISLHDSPAYQWLRPAVTAVSLCMDCFAAKIVQRLLEKMNNPNIAPDKVLIPAQLVERASVCPPLQHKH